MSGIFQNLQEILQTGRNQEQSSSSVDDTSGGAQDRAAAVGDGLVDTPVLASRAGAGNGSVGNRTRV